MSKIRCDFCGRFGATRYEFRGSLHDVSVAKGPLAISHAQKPHWSYLCQRCIDKEERAARDAQATR